jgi:Tfp pilus assembly protein PilN
MNSVVFLPSSLLEKKKLKRFYIKGLIVVLMSNIFLLLFFYVPYNNLAKLRKENNNLKLKYSINGQKKVKEYETTKAYKKEKQLLETVGLIEKEKQTLGANLNIFKNINCESMCIETISYENDKIAIQGKAADYDMIIRFLGLINGSRLYTMARLTRVDFIEQNKSFLFQLNIKLKGEV